MNARRAVLIYLRASLYFMRRPLCSYTVYINSSPARELISDAEGGSLVERIPIPG